MGMIMAESLVLGGDSSAVRIAWCNEATALHCYNKENDVRHPLSYSASSPDCVVTESCQLYIEHSIERFDLDKICMYMGSTRALLCFYRNSAYATFCTNIGPCLLVMFVSKLRLD